MRSFVVLMISAGVACGQNLHPVPGWPMAASDIAITRAAEFTKPFTVSAEHGAVFGDQNGVFEAWTFPIKVLSHFQIEADLADYPVPIDLNQYAAQIEVNPERTTITYSHSAFTVRQHMFSPRGNSVKGAGAVVLFQIESIRPVTLTFRFTPEMLRMWPAANFGRPSAEWVKQGASGFYILHTDTETLAGGVAIPGATPGVLAPYQERPQTYPVELKLRFDPKTDAGRFYPLLVVSGASKEVPGLLASLNQEVAALYHSTQDYYAHFFDHRLTVESPDPRFDQALKWAEVAIDQAQVKFHDETGLVAGYYTSADSARPGYGWFFGRDTEFSLYAIHGYGDFALSREALEFLFRRQRADGKIMHEFSQTADLLDWKTTPYFYAAADSTPLLVMAMEDYVNVSGDTAFLAKHWDEVKRAYAFTRAHDSDGDGIYNNSEGTGWVESWPPGMPNQEIYLAAMDQQSASAIGRLAALIKDDVLSKQASAVAEQIRAKLTSEYYDTGSKFYAFSRNADGSTDKSATIYPSVAWWAGTLALPDAAPMLERWASAEFSTDWGTRDLSETSPLYDPISYHQGTVWPLFTGWVSMAEYRAGQTISAEAHLYQNLLLTWAQDLGGCTELLSGAFYQPLGRSSSHQTWSSAMILTPALRGLLGLSWDATHGMLRIEPHLPAEWDRVRVHNVPLGADYVEVEMVREHDHLRVTAKGGPAFRLCTVVQDCASIRPSSESAISVALPALEVGLAHEMPAPGSVTSQIKAVSQTMHSITFTSQGGSVYRLPLRLNRAGIKVMGGTVEGNRLRIVFPEGSGYQRATISW